MSREASDFGNALAEVVGRTIHDKGVTKAGVARVAGIPRTTFYRRLRGESPFYLWELLEVGRALGVPASELVRRAGG